MVWPAHYEYELKKKDNIITLVFEINRHRS